MSIISIEGTEKCIVSKLRSVVAKSFVATSTPAWRSVSKEQSSKFKAFNHDTTVPQLKSKFEVFKPYGLK